MDPPGSSHSGERRNGFVRQGLHHRGPEEPRPEAHRRLQPRRAQAVRVPPAVQRRPPAALVHRRHPRPAPPEPGDARGRLRGPRGRAEAGRHRGVQPVGVRADQRGRVAERHRGLHRPGREEGRGALDRQGVLPDQPLRRDQADRRQAVRHRQPLRRRLPDPVQRGPLRQRHGQPRLGDPVLPQARRRRSVAAHHGPADDPVLHHPAAGGQVRHRLLRDHAGRRAVRPADPVDEDRRPRPGRGPRRGDARDRAAPRREAARGDDLPRGGPPRPADRRPLRPPARPRVLGLHRPPSTASRSRTASTTRSDNNDEWFTREDFTKLIETDL